MLQLAALTLTRGSKCLLKDAQAVLAQKQRVGLIGQNGTGKSSLFKAIVGEVSLDSGDISIPSNWRVSVLEQNLPDCQNSVLEAACEGDKEWHAINQTLTQAEESNDAHLMAECHERLAIIDGYTIEGRASKICRGLGFLEADLSRPVSDFSGGWQMRVQLAKLLLSRGDLLLMDEPTNHLDLESGIWLESWLQSYRGCALVISHDRDFLDSVTTHTLHLSQQKLTLYQGSYTQFVRQREEKLILQSKSSEKVAAKRAHMQAFVDRFRAKATKAKQAQSRLKALEKLQFSSDLEEESGFSFHFLETQAVPYPAVSISGNAGYDAEPILKSIHLSLGAGDRIGIVGSNGSGKTTLLKSLLGEIPMLAGECVRHPHVKAGYYSQLQLESLDKEASPFQMIQRLHKDWREGQIRSYLGGFNFQGDRVFEKVTHFSGGELARVALALLVCQKPNILILDEPTNHLDITMREALILALQSYTGTLLVVSHDRHLLTSCVDRYLLVHNKRAQMIEGTFEDYQAQVLEANGDSPKKKKGQDQHSSSHEHELKKKSLRLSDKIEKLEQQYKALREELANPDLYETGNEKKLTDLKNKIDSINHTLKTKQDEWFAIEETLEEIKNDA